MSKGLSDRQKAVLSQLARRAYIHAGSTAADPLPALDEWRRAQVFAAVGRAGLTRCDGAHYNAVAAHFESILGNDDRALDHLVQEATHHRRQMMHAIGSCLSAADMPAAYAETISQARWKCQVADLSERQLGQLLITVRERARARRKGTHA